MPGLWRAGACKHLIVSIPTAPLIPPQAADDALPPLSHPCACAACRSTRLRRGSAVRSCPPAARCLGAAARRPRGGDGGDERRRGGRLFEAIENDTLVVTEMLAEGYWWFSPPSCCFNLIRWTPLTLGSSAFCCVRAGEEGDVPESRRHRLAVQVELGVFSEVCGHFYVAAGRWSAKRRLAESKDGGAVLKICISCHIHHHSPVEAATSPDLGSILAGGERHARGHEDACGGRQVVLATFLLCPTSSDRHH